MSMVFWWLLQAQEKTVMGCAILSKGKHPHTHSFVHRAPLLDQWRERLTEFVNFDVKKIGTINGQKKASKAKLTSP